MKPLENLKIKIILLRIHGAEVRREGRLYVRSGRFAEDAARVRAQHIPLEYLLQLLRVLLTLGVRQESLGYVLW